MRKPKVLNKYNLAVADIKKLEVVDRSKISEPTFTRNDVIGAWCVTDNTIKTNADREYSTYNDYYMSIYDEDSSVKSKLKVECNAFGGMCGYNFKRFFDFKEIENEMDLEIQEKLLEKINELIDNNILKISK